MSFVSTLKFHVKAVSQDDQVNPGKTSVTLIPLIPVAAAPTPAPPTPPGRTVVQGVNGVVTRLGGSQGGLKGAYPGYIVGQAIPFLIPNADAAGLTVGMDFVLTPAP